VADLEVGRGGDSPLLKKTPNCSRSLLSQAELLPVQEEGPFGEKAEKVSKAQELSLVKGGSSLAGLKTLSAPNARNGQQSEPGDDFAETQREGPDQGGGAGYISPSRE